MIPSRKDFYVHVPPRIFEKLTSIIAPRVYLYANNEIILYSMFPTAKYPSGCLIRFLSILPWGILKYKIAGADNCQSGIFTSGVKVKVVLNPAKLNPFQT